MDGWIDGRMVIMADSRRTVEHTFEIFVNRIRDTMGRAEIKLVEYAKHSSR